MPIPHDLLGELTQRPRGRCRRISSNQQPNWNDGNMDMTRLAPGEEFELPVLEGPGCITHIWFTSHAGGVGELNALSMRIYWDGRDEPGVEVPVGDFFACGNNPVVVESLPVQVSPSGALTCYWRMPFSKSARIVIKNDNMERATGLYWQVDWVRLSEPLPEDTGYFHARYRQEYPAVMGRDYLLAEIEGAGQYVGTVMSITMAQDGWFGEGDDFFYIDGEEVPSLQGTGSEDYFNDAWGFRQRTSAWFGQPWWTGWEAGDWGVCYRWHVLDPVGFEKSLRVTIEHKGNRSDAAEAWYIERPDFLSSIAFWYQIGEPMKLFGSLPGWPERNVPWVQCHLLKALTVAQVTGGATLVPQVTGLFGGRPLLFWPNTAKDGTLAVPFSVANGGRHALRLSALSAPDYGVYDVEVDGAPLVTDRSFRSDRHEVIDLLLGVRDLTAGQHTLTFRCKGADRDTQYLGVEALNLLALPDEVNREVKTDNEAHFVRGAIGSAVFAYNTAYGKLPESLEMLIEAGVLDARYLKDENMQLLEAGLTSDGFLIRSTGADGWEKTFQGLDARR